MHNYSIANRYKTKTKIGNWYQEIQKDDYDFKQYLYQKNNNMNLTLNNQSKITFSTQPIQLSQNTDGFIYYGQNFVLGNEKTHGFLSFNIYQPLSGQETYAVTTSLNLQPCLRNVFHLQPLVEGKNNSVIYGQKLRIVSHSGERKLYLQSISVSPMRSSKFSRYQQVSVTADINSNTIWTIDHIDPKKRFLQGEQPVRAEDQILFRHIPTSQWLASDLVNYVNNFGAQYEVFAKSWLTFNKTQNLYAQKVGHRTADNPLRTQGPQNSWRIIKKKEKK